MKSVVCLSKTKETIASIVTRKFLFFRWKRTLHTPLCRNHLAEEIEKVASQLNHQTIIVSPDLPLLGSFKGGYTYYADSIRNICQNFSYVQSDRPEVEKKLNEWMTLLGSAHCSCGNDACIAYLERNSVPYRKVTGFLGSEFNVPIFTEAATPLLLCPVCAGKRLQRDFILSLVQYSEGVHFSGTALPQVILACEL